jgi:pyrroline-5-carboxylate reductase
MAVSNNTTRNPQATAFRLGMWGAGRLGEAMSKVWRARAGEAPLVWSRGGRRPADNNVERVAGGAWVAGWADALAARSVVVALPGSALLDLAEGSEQAKRYEGSILSAAASLSPESLRRVFPRATLICIAPFLIEADSIPMLALRPAGLSESEWQEAARELYRFGDVEVVEDGELFARLSLLGASWPVVVRAAIQAAAGVGVRGLEGEAAGLGRRLFFRALRALLSEESVEGSEGGDSVATPGGITERGLENVEGIAVLFESAYGRMRARADELRA